MPRKPRNSPNPPGRPRKDGRPAGSVPKPKRSGVISGRVAPVAKRGKRRTNAQIRKQAFLDTIAENSKPLTKASRRSSGVRRYNVHNVSQALVRAHQKTSHSIPMQRPKGLSHMAQFFADHESNGMSEHDILTTYQKEACPHDRQQEVAYLLENERRVTFFVCDCARVRRER